MANGIKSSGLIAASAVVSATPCKLWGYIMTNTGTLAIFNNATAGTGTIVGQTSTVGVPVILTKPVACSAGLYATLTTTTAIVVYYEPGLN